MIKTILVPLQGLARDYTALTGVLGIATTFGSHLECLHVRPDPRTIVAGTTAGIETGMGVGVFPAELLNVLIETDKRRARIAREHFDKFCRTNDIVAQSPAQGVSASYREVEGDPARQIVKQARYDDLVVLGSGGVESELSWDAAGDIVIGCGRPILLVPPNGAQSTPRVVTIAWKNTAEAARALTAAMPLLAKARTIVVLAAHEEGKLEETLASADQLATRLKRHGFSARAEHVPYEGKRAPEALIERALALESELLVMGAYGHSRVREFVFGGFTQHAIHETKMPTLIAH